MSNFNRAEAVHTVADLRDPVAAPVAPVCLDFYGEDVFSADVMKEYLPKTTAEKLLATINNGAPLDPQIAGDVAHAMKRWAMDRGATHYTHWFLPLTGSTAEKHDSFLEIKRGKPIMAFSGKNLTVSEPDASSFPSGGLRSTFEARGYTAWDPTSPAFIKRNGHGATLCIPTAFCSYTGDALDKKTPLLRSSQALSRSVERLMKCFGKEGEKVSCTLGAEQEYFLVDKHLYYLRPDLLQTGRTLFGAPPPKHQQLEDHYFGTIKQRILNFMAEVEHDLWTLGIPAKTRHNEVAPAQFELAPIFEELNLACDHNMLVMEILREVADRNGLVCLLHEKPFAGVNGSGKHNNWSVSYGKQNLLDPGDDPDQNAIFLTVLTAIIAAVDRHADLLRVTVAGAGNDHRLGANEAPPAIISIYLGDQLGEVISRLENGGGKANRKAGTLRIGVDTLPQLPRDATDRNRTSPFAFTGNKFEFRAPGSSQACAAPNTILNTIVAESLDDLAEKIEKFPKDVFNEKLQKLLGKTIHAHSRILFNGNGYTDDWTAEAARRGLPNTPSTPDALASMTIPENLALFEKYGVYSPRELASRHEVALEEYRTKILIEGKVALEMALEQVRPAAVKAYSKAAGALVSARTAGLKEGTKALREEASELGRDLDCLATATKSLRKATEKRDEKAILLAMAELRAVVDHLEDIVPDSDWPLPKYRELLFVY